MGKDNVLHKFNILQQGVCSSKGIKLVAKLKFN